STSLAICILVSGDISGEPEDFVRRARLPGWARALTAHGVKGKGVEACPTNTRYGSTGVERKAFSIWPVHARCSNKR
ncbi:MAG: hypothetical protein MK010_10865, partial [Erythrobacter sp.]|nr:hypothetical protein [Erythrobacter sp.]